MKYRKKPIVVEAVMFNGSTAHAANIKRWMDGEVDCPDYQAIHSRDMRPLEIDTLEGRMTALPGDYIIKGVEREFYPCKPDIFHQTYDVEHASHYEVAE